MAEYCAACAAGRGGAAAAACGSGRIAVLCAMACSTDDTPTSRRAPPARWHECPREQAKRASVRSTSAEWRAVGWFARGEPSAIRCSAVQRGATRRGSARRYAKHQHSCDEQYCWQRCAVDGCVKVRALQHATCEVASRSMQHARLRQGPSIARFNMQGCVCANPPGAATAAQVCEQREHTHVLRTDPT